MAELLNTLSQYIDFLVLGAFAFAALCAPFGPTRFTKWWSLLSTRLKSRETSVLASLIAGVLFALFYFSGYVLSAVGGAFLHPAHVSIVDAVATTRFDPSEKSDTVLGLKPVFFAQVIPVIGPLLSTPAEPELKNYWRDATRQIFWEVCDQKSADDLLAGNALKELRLLRGIVGLTQILLPLCLLAYVLNRRFEHDRAWPLSTFFAALCIYSLLIIPSYSLVEYDTHITIWAAFPGDLDKDTDKIDVDHMDKLLPCRKMELLAGQSKNETTASENLSPRSNSLKNR